MLMLITVVIIFLNTTTLILLGFMDGTSKAATPSPHIHPSRRNTPSPSLTSPASCFESLITINKKLDQYDAAVGILTVAEKMKVGKILYINNIWCIYIFDET